MLLDPTASHLLKMVRCHKITISWGIHPVVQYILNIPLLTLVLHEQSFAKTISNSTFVSFLIPDSSCRDDFCYQTWWLITLYTHGTGHHSRKSAQKPATKDLVSWLAVESPPNLLFVIMRGPPPNSDFMYFHLQWQRYPSNWAWDIRGQ